MKVGIMIICENCNKKQRRGYIFNDTPNGRCCDNPSYRTLPDDDGGQVERVVMLRPKILYHCTTTKKAKRYKASGKIIKPVRGFENITAAMAWCMRTGRNIIYAINVNDEFLHKLPDHHNKFGDAWWIDEDISEYKCEWSSAST